MRRTTINSGFFICFIANLIVNWEWGFIAVLLWGFSYWFNLSWYPAAAMAVLWLLMGVLLCVDNFVCCQDGSLFYFFRLL